MVKVRTSRKDAVSEGVLDAASEGVLDAASAT